MLNIVKMVISLFDSQNKNKNNYYDTMYFLGAQECNDKKKIVKT